MILGNPGSVLQEMWHQILAVARRSEYTVEFQQQLLLLLYELLEMVDEGGLKRLDEHIEIPANSSVFQRYPLILQDLHLITFISDNFRLMAMGKINQHELESILEQELSAVEEELLVPSRSFQRIGEAMPGFGICAAVLGIIITMQSIDGSIAMIGIKVAAALVGTFLGVFICYCLMDPLSNAMEQEIKRNWHYLNVCAWCWLIMSRASRHYWLWMRVARCYRWTTNPHLPRWTLGSIS